MEAARPTHTVETSGRTCRIVSNTAMPAVCGGGGRGGGKCVCGGGQGAVQRYATKGNRKRSQRARAGGQGVERDGRGAGDAPHAAAGRQAGVHAPAVTEPPGELMYRVTSLPGSAESR